MIHQAQFVVSLQYRQTLLDKDCKHLLTETWITISRHPGIWLCTNEINLSCVVGQWDMRASSIPKAAEQCRRAQTVYHVRESSQAQIVKMNRGDSSPSSAMSSSDMFAIFASSSPSFLRSFFLDKYKDMDAKMIEAMATIARLTA